eukprot:51126_1
MTHLMQNFSMHLNLNWATKISFSFNPLRKGNGPYRVLMHRVKHPVFKASSRNCKVEQIMHLEDKPGKVEVTGNNGELLTLEDYHSYASILEALDLRRAKLEIEETGLLDRYRERLALSKRPFRTPRPKRLPYNTPPNPHEHVALIRQTRLRLFREKLERNEKRIRKAIRKQVLQGNIPGVEYKQYLDSPEHFKAARD